MPFRDLDSQAHLHYATVTPDMVAVPSRAGAFPELLTTPVRRGYRERVKIALVLGSLLLVAFLVAQAPKITHCEGDGWCKTSESE